MNPLICWRCGDVIGAYEPLVLILDGQARITSKAAEPRIASEPGERYHRHCNPHSPTPPPNEGRRPK